MRISVREILTTRLGWSDSDAQKFAANVSHFYDNRIRHEKAPKDAQGSLSMTKATSTA